jgi:hypothetical protein
MIMPQTEDVRACHKAPTTKSTSARRMTGLRPRWSASRPVRGEARSAKREVQLVMRDLSRVVRGREERSVLMETRVEEMTPVLVRLSVVLVTARHTQRQNTPCRREERHKILYRACYLPKYLLVTK